LRGVKTYLSPVLGGIPASDAGSDAGSVLGSSVEVIQALRALADIAAFQAECLAKLSGVPMPDFDVGAEGDL